MAASVMDQFCLRWNDFQANISDAFKELREEKDFFDVTLACDDSQIDAHKVILSACSPFFRNVLKRNPHQHPLLYLKGVKFKELISVLNFMYLGEVNVAQDELSSFLAVAEELKVKGLSQNNPANGTKPVPKQENSRPTNHAREPPEEDPFPPSKKKPDIVNLSKDTDEIPEFNPSSFKSEPNDQTSNPAIPNSSPPQPQLEAELPLPNQMTGAGSMVGDESLPADESYHYDQHYEDGSAITDHNTVAGLDAHKVKVKSPSKLYGNWNIHHHPKDSPVNSEQESGQNPFSMDSLDLMDSTDCFADPTQDWDTVVASRMLKKDNFWQCSECSYMARNKTSVISHVQGKHLEDFAGYICKVCGGKSGTYCGFEKHMSRQHKFSLARKNNANSILSVKFEEH